MYVPNNLFIFVAAYAGAISGMAVAEKVLTDEDPADYDAIAAVAGAFAQSFDTEWGMRPTTELDISIVEEECEGTWEGRYPKTTDPITGIPSTYTAQCKALIALVTSCEAYFTGQGIVPPVPGGPPGPPGPPGAPGAPGPPGPNSAVIFDGGVNAQNIRANRAVAPSPIDNTQDGIVNLGFDNTGASLGATAFGSTIGGGNANSNAGPIAVIGGGGSNVITSNGQGGTIAGGGGNSVDAPNASVLGGGQNSANAYASVIIGGEQTTAVRAYQEALRPSIYGQRGTYYTGRQANNNVPGITGDQLGGQFFLEPERSYIIDVTAIATKLSAPRGPCAAFKAIVLAHCTLAGIAVIDQYIPNPANAALLNGTLFAFGMSVSGLNNILTANFTGIVNISNCLYRFDWMEAN